MKVKRTLLFFIICLSITTTAYTEGMISVSYYPNYNINGDEEELDDLLSGDDYTYLSLEESDAFSIKYSYDLGKPPHIDVSDVNHIPAFIYMEYTLLDLEGKEGEREEGRYQSLTVGLSFLSDIHSWKYIGTYCSGGVGIGASYFDISTSKVEAAGEIFLEGGASFLNHLYLGLGGKYQIIGYPSETVAQASGVYIGLSVRY